jgi:hypothetical protein
MGRLMSGRNGNQPSVAPSAEAGRAFATQLRHAEQFAYIGVQDMALECAAIVRFARVVPS